MRMSVEVIQPVSIAPVELDSIPPGVLRLNCRCPSRELRPPVS